MAVEFDCVSGRRAAPKNLFLKQNADNQPASMAKTKTASKSRSTPKRKSPPKTVPAAPPVPPAFKFVTHLAWIALYLVFLRYLDRLARRPDCACAKTPLRDALVALFVLKLAYHAGLLVFPVELPLSVRATVLALAVAEIVLVLLYLRHLRKVACTCSEAAARTVLEVVTYVRLALLALVVLLALSIVLGR
jgi:hypothetical protein